MANEFAGPGEVFVCTACGKRSKDRYGDQAITDGWDTSCMTWSVRCREEDIVLFRENGRVKSFREGARAIS
jgi:hypothetical protein